MLRLLKHGKAAGVVIHKIDRGARNLKDWADLAELIDIGVEVHFANESLDLNTRGGRLSADIQAVVAADFIRNLREETKKGFYGRLKQGLYPICAPIVIWIAAAVKQRCPTQRWPDSFARRLNSMPPAISHCPVGRRDVRSWPPQPSWFEGVTEWHVYDAKQSFLRWSDPPT